MGWREGEPRGIPCPVPPAGHPSEIRDRRTKEESQVPGGGTGWCWVRTEGRAGIASQPFLGGGRILPASERGTKPSLVRSSKGAAPSSGALMSLFRQFADYFPGTVHPDGLCCGGRAVSAPGGVEEEGDDALGKLRKRGDALEGLQKFLALPCHPSASWRQVNAHLILLHDEIQAMGLT